MKCERCEATLPEQARFCEQCGEPAATRQPDVRSEQNVRSLRGQAVGIIDTRGEDRRGVLSASQKIDTVEEGGSAVGAILGDEGSRVHVGGTQNYDNRRVNTGGGAHVAGNVNTQGGDFAGRDFHKVVYATDSASPFGRVYRYIDSRPESDLVGKDELQEKVGRIESEAGKGDGADADKIRRWLKELAEVAPDAAEATAAALADPASGAAAAVRGAAERALREAGLKSD